jgi:hypothetical protein
MEGAWFTLNLSPIGDSDDGDVFLSVNMSENWLRSILSDVSGLDGRYETVYQHDSDSDFKPMVAGELKSIPLAFRQCAAGSGKW